MVLAVNVGAVASPLALVVTTQVRPEHGAANVPDAPEAGAVNATDVFGSGLLAGVVSFATSGTPNADPGVVVCADPELAVIVSPVIVGAGGFPAANASFTK